MAEQGLDGDGNSGAGKLTNSMEPIRAMSGCGGEAANLLERQRTPDEKL
jgi:hypothetical protein